MDNSNLIVNCQDLHLEEKTCNNDCPDIVRRAALAAELAGKNFEVIENNLHETVIICADEETAEWIIENTKQEF